MEIRRKLIAGVLALFATAASTIAADINALALVPAMNEKGYIDKKIISSLQEKHINIVERKQSDPLSMEMLKQFHEVLWIDGMDAPQKVVLVTADSLKDSVQVKKNQKLLADYVKEGGGLFASPSVQVDEQVMKFYGLELLVGQIRDDAHSYKSGEYGSKDYFQYSWTTDVAKHPACEGVKTIFYPTGEICWQDVYTTNVFKFSDPSWITLVKSMEGSSAALGDGSYRNWFPFDKKPQAVAAVREFGKGRTGALALDTSFTFRSPFAERGPYEGTTGLIDGIFIEKGDGKIASDGLKLIVGMINWIAEPAEKAGLGKYDKDKFAAMKAAGPDEAQFKWLQTWSPDDGNTWFKVFIGARSSYSDGEGTIAEYAAAAKNAGVSLLLMTETFERLDKSKWRNFLEDCDKASDETTKVSPGLDIPDAHGGRYLLLGTRVLPMAPALSADGKTMLKTNYLCLCFPDSLSVAHRTTTSQLPQEFLKFFHAISVYTYRNGELVDDSLPAYQFQNIAYSCPMPLAVHETYSPKDIQAEATKGYQTLVAADNLKNLWWYMGLHGGSHFWTTPKIQLSAGPLITRIQNGLTIETKPPQAAQGLEIESDAAISEVRVYDNYTLLNRWKPDAKKFAVSSLQNPHSAHISSMLIMATDSKGRSVISSMNGGGGSGFYTWRCSDRQNWICNGFQNWYTGTELAGFDLQVPCFGTPEGSSLSPDSKFRRGDNMAVRLQFPFAGRMCSMQDAVVDERYYDALSNDVRYDAKPLWNTSPSRVYTAKVRYENFPALAEQDLSLPMRKSVSIELRRQIDPSGNVFPVFTSLDSSRTPVKGDMTYAYTDPVTGGEVAGKLEKGKPIDLPRGGRAGGLIALCDGIRVESAGANAIVGFAAPKWVNGSLPAGSSWKAAFTTVPPAEAESWRKLMGLSGKCPYELSFTQGKLSSLAYVAECKAENYGIAGTVSKALKEDELAALSVTTQEFSHKAKYPNTTSFLKKYLMPVYVEGVNYNWPAAVLRDGKWDNTESLPEPGKDIKQVEVFEGKGIARLDVGRPGSFYIGNVIISDNQNLRINAGHFAYWTDKKCPRLQVNNPTDSDIDAEVWTSPEVKDKAQGRAKFSIKAGGNLEVILEPSGASK